MARMPGNKVVKAVWEDALRLIEITNVPSGLEILGLRVDIFRIDKAWGGASIDQVHLTHSHAMGEEVGSHTKELVQGVFSCANFFDFERRGQHFRGGNIVNDQYVDPGAFQVVSYDKDMRRAVVVSFSSPVPEGRKISYYGWSCTKGARQLTELISTMFGNLILPESVEVAA